MSFRLHPNRDALFLDIDGTLLDMAPMPDAVVVPPGLIENLTGLSRKLDGALALISGRPLQNIDALFHPLRLPASGVHGAQWRLATQQEELNVLPESVRQAVLAEMAKYPGAVVEDKRYAMAVHYRSKPELADYVERALRGIVSSGPDVFSVMRGKMVCEIVYSGHNKGMALEHFMKHTPFAGRRPVFLGDDETDAFAIEACRKLGGIATRIGYENVFSSPQDVRMWLEKQAA